MEYELFNLFKDCLYNYGKEYLFNYAMNIVCAAIMIL